MNEPINYVQVSRRASTVVAFTQLGRLGNPNTELVSSFINRQLRGEFKLAFKKQCGIFSRLSLWTEIHTGLGWSFSPVCQSSCYPLVTRSLTPPTILVAIRILLPRPSRPLLSHTQLMALFPSSQRALHFLSLCLPNVALSMCTLPSRASGLRSWGSFQLMQGTIEITDRGWRAVCWSQSN